MAIEKSCRDLNKLNDDPRELLLVIEGTLTDEMMGPELLQLLESGTFILKEDGQVVVKERKVCTLKEDSLEEVIAEMFCLPFFTAVRGSYQMTTVVLLFFW